MRVASAEALETVLPKYLDFLDTAYGVALRFTKDPLKAARLTEQAIRSAVLAELTEGEEEWPKRRLLTHLRCAFLAGHAQGAA
ncbi:MAG: hypothetical protein GY851_10755 [bacterium]|nr:hypothetical protein [bacterium]